MDNMDNQRITDAISIVLNYYEGVEDSWCQFTNYVENKNGTMGYCLNGAFGDLINQKLSPNNEFFLSDNEYLSCRKLLQNITGCRSIEYWNDIPDRTRKEVIDLLKTAIERLNHESN